MNRMRLSGAVLVAMAAAANVLACGGDDFRPAPADSSGSSASAGGAGSGGGSADGGADDGGAATGTGGTALTACTPGETADCYDGPDGTQNVGNCASGTRTCNADGTAFGACQGAVLPQDGDDCSTPEDDDCNGEINDACACTPAAVESCYSGPAGTEGIGSCKAGTHACDVDGSGFGPCGGEVLPAVEDCANPADEDCSGLACAQGLWSKLAGDASSQETTAVAVDASGNVYAAGVFHGTLGLGGSPLISGGSGDVFVAKFDSAGNHVWSKQFGGALLQTPDDIALGPNGEIAVVGRYSGSITFGSTTHTAVGERDNFVVLLDASGAVAWSQSAKGAPYDGLASVALDGAGNAVTAWTFDSYFCTFGGCYNHGLDVGVRKWSPTGTLLWYKLLSDAGTSSQVSSDLAVNAVGNVLVVGSFSTSMTSGALTLTSAGQLDAFVVKLDSAGNTAWAKKFGGSDTDVAHGVAVDASGNPVVTGRFEGLVDFGGQNLTSAGGYDMYVHALTSGGTTAWAQRFGDAATQYGSAVAVDSGGSIVALGVIHGSTSFGGPTLSDPGEGNLALVKLDATGGHAWSKTFGDGLAQLGRSVAVGPANEIVIAGRAEGTSDFGAGPMTAAGATDAVLAKFAP